MHKAVSERDKETDTRRVALLLYVQSSSAVRLRPENVKTTTNPVIMCVGTGPLAISQ